MPLGSSSSLWICYPWSSEVPELTQKAHLVLIGITSRNMSRLFQSQLGSGSTWWKAQANVPWWNQKFGEWLQRHLNGSPQSQVRPRKAYKLWLSIITADSVLILGVEPCSATCATLPRFPVSRRTFYPVYPTDVGYLCFHVALCLSSQAMWISEHW